MGPSTTRQEDVMDPFEQVWSRIEQHAGQTFRQKRGARFTYRVRSDMVTPDRTNYSFPKSQFRKAFDRMPVDGPGELQDLRGPSYLYAILTDPRVDAG